VLVVNKSSHQSKPRLLSRIHEPLGAVVSVALRSKQSHPVFVTTMSMPQDTAPARFFAEILSCKRLFQILPLEKARVTQLFADAIRLLRRKLAGRNRPR
jgi:hypothetical protein